MLDTKLAPWAITTCAAFVAWMITAASGCGPSERNFGSGGNAGSSSGMGGESTSSSSSGGSGDGLAGYPGGLFKMPNPWTKDVSGQTKSTASDAIIAWLD